MPWRNPDPTAAFCRPDNSLSACSPKRSAVWDVGYRPPEFRRQSKLLGKWNTAIQLFSNVLANDRFQVANRPEPKVHLRAVSRATGVEFNGLQGRCTHGCVSTTSSRAGRWIEYTRPFCATMVVCGAVAKHSQHDSGVHVVLGAVRHPHFRE